MSEDVVVLDVEKWVLSPVCRMCEHIRTDGDAFRQCDAFPSQDGIPVEIWNGDNPHTSPFPGDGGMQFEQVKP